MVAYSKYRTPGMAKDSKHIEFVNMLIRALKQHICFVFPALGRISTYYGGCDLVHIIDISF